MRSATQQDHLFVPVRRPEHFIDNRWICYVGQAITKMMSVYRYFLVAITKAFAFVQNHLFLSVDLEYRQVHNAVSTIDTAFSRAVDIAFLVEFQFISRNKTDSY